MILGVLQARVSSSRLPGKVLLPLIGKPMILRQIERIKRARRLDGLVLATSTDASDDPLTRVCEAEGVAVFRGSLNDVLDRFYQAAKPHKPEWVVRLTGDCPLADPAVIDRVIDETIAAGAEYGSNALNPVFPDGLDTEVVRWPVLERALREAQTTAEREHVTLFIHRRPEMFRLHSVTQREDFSHMRWTVDEPRDLDLVTKIYERLYPGNPAFTARDVYALLKREPELCLINGSIRRNEGLEKSLAEDRKA